MMTRLDALKKAEDLNGKRPGGAMNSFSAVILTREAGDEGVWAVLEYGPLGTPVRLIKELTP